MTLFHIVFRFLQIVDTDGVYADSTKEARQIFLKWYPEADIISIYPSFLAASTSEDNIIWN